MFWKGWGRVSDQEKEENTRETPQHSTRETMADKLRAAGLKPTPQRVAIYEMLTGTTAHPGAETIYEALKVEFPTLSLNTVYSTLQALVDAGLLRKLAMRENMYRYDANTLPHSHFICVRCGSVTDLGPLVDEELKKIQPALTKKIGGLILDHEHHFYGYCAECKT